MLAVDITNRKELTEEMASELSLTLPILLDDEGISRDDYGVFATPTTLLIDSKGRIIFKHVGYAEGMERMLEKELRLLLQRKAI